MDKSEFVCITHEQLYKIFIQNSLYYTLEKLNFFHSAEVLFPKYS